MKKHEYLMNVFETARENEMLARYARIDALDNETTIKELDVLYNTANYAHVMHEAVAIMKKDYDESNSDSNKETILSLIKELESEIDLHVAYRANNEFKELLNNTCIESIPEFSELDGEVQKAIIKRMARNRIRHGLSHVDENGNSKPFDWSFFCDIPYYNANMDMIINEAYIRLYDMEETDENGEPIPFPVMLATACTSAMRWLNKHEFKHVHNKIKLSRKKAIKAGYNLSENETHKDVVDMYAYEATAPDAWNQSSVIARTMFDSIDMSSSDRRIALMLAYGYKRKEICTVCNLKPYELSRIESRLANIVSMNNLIDAFPELEVASDSMRKNADSKKQLKKIVMQAIACKMSHARIASYLHYSEKDINAMLADTSTEYLSNVDRKHDVLTDEELKRRYLETINKRMTEEKKRVLASHKNDITVTVSDGIRTSHATKKQREYANAIANSHYSYNGVDSKETVGNAEKNYKNRLNDRIERQAVFGWNDPIIEKKIQAIDKKWDSYKEYAERMKALNEK